MKALVVSLVLLSACERAHTTSNRQPPPKPNPVELDPIKQAREEFELLPDDYAAGTSKLYSRGDFLPSPDLKKQYDDGDFIGRLHTLFGPRDGNDYVLRHKATGYIITAYSAGSGPAFGAGPRYQGPLPPTDKIPGRAFNTEDPAVTARKAADPLLAPGQPTPTTPEKLEEYTRHLADAEAGPELAGAIRRLAALIEEVPPADWEETVFYDEAPAVLHLGAKAGRSFETELPPDEAFAWLADQAERSDPNDRGEHGEIPFEADSNALLFYVEHMDELPAQRPRALAAYKRLVVAARTYSGDLRGSILDEARELARRLHVAPP